MRLRHPPVQGPSWRGRSLAQAKSSTYVGVSRAWKPVVVIPNQDIILSTSWTLHTVRVQQSHVFSFFGWTMFLYMRSCLFSNSFGSFSISDYDHIDPLVWGATHAVHMISHGQSDIELSYSRLESISCGGRSKKRCGWPVMVMIDNATIDTCAIYGSRGVWRMMECTDNPHTIVLSSTVQRSRYWYTMVGSYMWVNTGEDFDNVWYNDGICRTSWVNHDEVHMWKSDVRVKSRLRIDLFIR